MLCKSPVILIGFPKDAECSTCGRAVSGTAVRTALVYYCIHTVAVYIQGLYTVYNGAGVQGSVAMLELAVDQGRRQPPQTYFKTVAGTFVPSILKLCEVFYLFQPVPTRTLRRD